MYMTKNTMSNLTFPDGHTATREDIMRLASQYANEDMAPDNDLCTPGCRHDQPCIECMAEDLLRLGEESSCESSCESSFESGSSRGSCESSSGSSFESSSGSCESSCESSESSESSGSSEEESEREDESEAKRDVNYIEKRRLKTLAVVSRAKRKAEKLEEMDADDEDEDTRDPPAIKRLRVELEMLDAIQIEQRRTEPVIGPAMFRRLAAEFSRETVYTRRALEALQQAAETYLVDMFERANLVAIHAGREVVAPCDIQLARRLAGDFQAG